MAGECGPTILGAGRGRKRLGGDLGKQFRFLIELIKGICYRFRGDEVPLGETFLGGETIHGSNISANLAKVPRRRYGGEQSDQLRSLRAQN